MSYTPRPARQVRSVLPKDVPGLSARQLYEHFKLYQGYVEKINEIQREVLPKVDRSNANSTYSPYRCAKTGQTYATNAVRLHELYFTNIGPGSSVPGNPPVGAIEDLILRDFGTVEFWQQDLIASGLSSRGWVTLAMDRTDGQLYHFISDNHKEGIWLSYPLLVLDVYEHAYFMDYGTDRKAYLHTFLSVIRWDVVNVRLKNAFPRPLT